MPRVKTSHTPQLEFGRRWQRYMGPEGMAAGVSKIGHDLGFPVTSKGDDIRSTNGAANAPLCVDVIIEKLLERRDSQKQASYQEKHENTTVEWHIARNIHSAV